MWKANILTSSGSSSLMRTMAHQFLIWTRGLHGSQVGSVVSPTPTPIVWSHSLSQIISEMRGVRGSHTAEVNYRPGHTQFKRLGGHTHIQEITRLIFSWLNKLVSLFISYLSHFQAKSPNIPYFQLLYWEDWLLSTGVLVGQNNTIILGFRKLY